MRSRHRGVRGEHPVVLFLPLMVRKVVFNDEREVLVPAGQGDREVVLKALAVRAPHHRLLHFKAMGRPASV